eukprot:TRINITY_DN8937_c2_g1_i1.p1 TRINITY_DN8937_c2_g1~~TRINITY_DN8937_c2_g1_i1.p1  ORF type:complete len:543 (+),score=185.05 TRINITY_DN8937_c2_g1_i1:114-1742(+)
MGEDAAAAASGSGGVPAAAPAVPSASGTPDESALPKPAVLSLSSGGLAEKMPRADASGESIASDELPEGGPGGISPLHPGPPGRISPPLGFAAAERLPSPPPSPGSPADFIRPSSPVRLPPDDCLPRAADRTMSTADSSAADIAVALSTATEAVAATRRGDLVDALYAVRGIVCASVHSPTLYQDAVATLPEWMQKALRVFGRDLFFELSDASDGRRVVADPCEDGVEGDGELLAQHNLKIALMGTARTLTNGGVSGGLHNNDTQQLHEFLTAFPTVEAMLHRRVCAPDSEQPDVTAECGAPPSPGPGNVTLRALRAADAAWAELHPVDPQYGPHDCELGKAAPPLEDNVRLRKVFQVNLAPRFPEEQWRGLIDFMERLHDALVIFCTEEHTCAAALRRKGADASDQPEQPQPVAAEPLKLLCPRLQNIIWTLYSGLRMIAARATPLQLWTALHARLSFMADQVKDHIKEREAERRRRYGGNSLWVRAATAMRIFQRPQPQTPQDHEFEAVHAQHRKDAEELLEMGGALIADLQAMRSVVEG